MYLAHAAGSGGVHTEYLLLGGALVVLAVIFFVQRSVKPVVSIVLLLAGFVLAGGAFALGNGAASSDASIQIVAPEEGATVSAEEPVTIEVELTGGSLTVETETADPDAGHYHVFVDGDLVAMPVSDLIEVELEPGEHEIEVEFTQADHTSYDPPVSDTIRITAE